MAPFKERSKPPLGRCRNPLAFFYPECFALVTAARLIGGKRCTRECSQFDIPVSARKLRGGGKHGAAAPKPNRTSNFFVCPPHRRLLISFKLTVLNVPIMYFCRLVWEGAGFHSLKHCIFIPAALLRAVFKWLVCFSKKKQYNVFCFQL